MTTLRIDNLNVTFSTEAGPLHALKNVSFDVPKDRIVGVVGESGCGKLTLINAIPGLLADNGTIDKGSILFEGKDDLTTLSPSRKRDLRGPRIATVFQDPMGALNPVTSVCKQMMNIQYRSKLSKNEKAARAVEMLELVRIPDARAALSRYPHQFSGGMKQRIAIAMALMMEPALLIADEPTTAMDATLEVTAIELLKDLQKKIGCSVMFISHQLGVIAELCDDVVVMYAGEVIERGSVRQIFHAPSSVYDAAAGMPPCTAKRTYAASADNSGGNPRSAGPVFGMHLCQPVRPCKRCLLSATARKGDWRRTYRAVFCCRRACGARSGRMSAEPILKVEDVQVSFPVGGMGGRSAILGVAGVSFEVNRGETFALVGESGSGKTTLARAVNGLQQISAGAITFENQRIDELDRRAMKPVRRRLSVMFQDPVGSLSPRMTVGDLVTEPFRIHGIEGRNLKDEAARLLTLVGLPTDFASRFPHQLSGGQARRVGVARAIALDPALIIADEPTAGLGVSVQGEVMNLLNDLRERLGLAMVIITHNLHVVHHVADRTAVMYLGRFVESGDTGQVFSAPQHPYTAALLSANPEPDPDKIHDRIMLPAEVPSLLARPDGCEFHTRCPWVQARCHSDAPSRQVTDGRAISCHFPLTPGARPPEIKEKAAS